SKVINEHNHPIAQSRLTYARNRRPTEEEMKSVTRLLSCGASNSVVIDNNKLEFDGMSNLLAKDVSNIRYRLTGVISDPQARSILMFITRLRDSDYDVRWEVNEKNEVIYLFFTHDVCIKQARRFSEVLIIDATYKVVRNKMPLVNIVGVDNVCRGKSDSLMTFAVAGGWIAHETTE
ncbi:hypothetical protein, partial, partial [Absidia glauca]